MHDALQKGDLKREAIWNTATSTITLNLVTSNDKIRLALICRDARNSQTTQPAAADQSLTQYAVSKTGVDTNANAGHTLLNCYDFRCLAWGDVMGDVRITEFADPDTFQQNLSNEIYGPIALWYDDNMAGYDTQIGYFFNNDSLYRGYYEFTLPYPNDSLALADFDSIKQALNRDFWPAEYDQIVWTDSVLQENSMDWLDALKQGGAKRVAVWHTTRSDVSLILSAENSKFILDLYYDDARSASY
jgi:hypothetical protein